ncbi:GntR family transcriptional regulator [Roseovarius sp.]|uniref:GntR family transcriptional regulator n=1 Tax=Roseovarius sp. TaxID=1486281 RepID=UPI0035641A73
MSTAKPNLAGSMPDDISPIENVPLRVQVADRLRNAILSGKLRPGTGLVETALAEQMNVSRAPIREAIQILENDGLVETIAYKGKRVKPLTAREVAETYSLREVFEVMAVRRILDNKASLDTLYAHCDEMTAAAKANNFEALVAADEAFHHSLIRLADHDLLMASWKNLYLRIHQIMALRNRDERNLSEVAGNHPPIVQAIADGDADRAISLITEHTRILAAFDPATIVQSLQPLKS